MAGRNITIGQTTHPEAAAAAFAAAGRHPVPHRAISVRPDDDGAEPNGGAAARAEDPTWCAGGVSSKRRKGGATKAPAASKTPSPATAACLAA